MENTQTYQAEFLGLKQPHLSMIFTGKKKVSWTLAEKLSRLFPEKDIQWWRYASPLQFKTYLNKHILSETHDGGK